MHIIYDVKVHGIDKLDAGCWAKWARDVKFAFLEAGPIGYLDGSVKPPADSKEKADWLQYNACIIGMLGCLVDDALAQELVDDMLAANAWSHLKQRMTQSGNIAKLNSMHATIAIKCLKSKEMNSTIGEIRVHLTSVFEDVTPT